MACQLQSEMFTSTEEIGGLEVQLAFYRGFGEMKVTKWLDSPEELVPPHAEGALPCWAHPDSKNCSTTR